ncbi:unnamed protein product [Spirodela intermedia]|uniref:Uncharacterized protein n=1 Tax=Spirodela intermedia TaxID=51605 RepID=A0A7I8K089_SPIIN|nr:unnamed protein product [Spirodela intermedia]
MYFEDYNDRQRTFEQVYRCYPTTFIDKPQLENGDKIIMPPSALDRLASLNIDYPMLFELENSSTQRVSHCGVLEFIAEEGMVYLPYWMMQNLLLEEGDVVRIKSATLPKGTYVKLQPHTTDFLDISNPKAILETSLRSFSCLTTGDTIMVAYNNKKYYIDIVETKPSAAVSIIETDCEVDFAPPLDYKEPEKPGKPAPLAAPPQAEEPVEEESKFSPFTGTARRLNGRPAEASPSPAPAPLSTAPKARAARAANGAGSSPPPPSSFPSSSSSSSTSSSASASQQPSRGKLMFGSADRKSESVEERGKAVAKDPPPQPPKEEEPEFKPFTGRRYSLRD